MTARSPRRLLPALAMALALAASGAPARADGVDPGGATPVQREQAQGRFLKGRELYTQGRFDAALEEFRGSHGIVASPNARLYTARCHRELGHLVAAYSEFGRTIVEAREHAQEDPRYARTAESADEERKALAPKLGFLTLTVPHAEPGTKLTVAGEEIPGGRAEAVPVEPGGAEIVVDTPGRAPIRQRADVAAGETKTMSVDAAAAPSTTPPVAAAPPAAPTDDAGRARMRTFSYVAGGVGVAGLATFAIFGALSNGKFEDLKTACRGGPCPPSRQDDIDAGRRDQTIANVGLVIGLIGVAAGVTLFLVSSPKKAPASSTGLVLAPTAGGIGGVF